MQSRPGVLWQWLDGGPPASSGITSTISKRKADSYTVDLATLKNGKLIETIHLIVSADGKSMRGTTKGTDPQGKKYEYVEVYDKQ